MLPQKKTLQIFKVKENTKKDARYTVRDIAQIVGISLSIVQFILKKTLNVRKSSARWIRRLLTDDQNINGLKMQKKRSPNISRIRLIQIS